MGHNPGRLSEKRPILAYTKKTALRRFALRRLAGGRFSMPGKEG